MELLAEDRQPKNSFRYGFKSGDAGVESVYIKRTAFKSKPPETITVIINEDT
jgi:hypothetical protein